ncbi:hypothetical protein ACODYM_11045 [Burkholderia gladioli]|uniref:hypothetical protein n=1 Tax=Burkholderia gladioli TaxID=28095 RepID=UPI003B50DD64
MSTPNNASSLNANIPPPNVPFIDSTGRVNPVWWMFLLQLFRRTGDQSGGDGQLTLGDILALEADIPVPIDIAAQVAQLSTALGQVFAAIAALQQTAPAFGEVMGVSSIAAGLGEMTMASGMSQSSMSEMTFARV